MKDSEKLRKKVESEFDRITDAFGGESYWAMYVGNRRGEKGRAGLTNLVGRINQYLGCYKISTTQGYS